MNDQTQPADRPIIGITPLVDIERDSLWMLPGYMEGIAAAGGAPVMLPLTEDEELLLRLMDACDGLLLSGGHDVDPALYGRVPIEQCGTICPQRDAMEGTLLNIALERDMPMLGVCRGLQFMNAALGGTLYQDLPTEHPGPVDHDMKPPYDAVQHQVSILPGTPLHDLLGTDGLGVNSRHHQAVERLAEPLRPMAVSEDGLIEAAWMPSKRFVWGVQWHPEHAWRTSAASRSVFAAFVDAANTMR
ncbi:gamma-glutamyl-gamma-aminobutyrate hydrolase family protein [Bifidobacterium amazonense]|uniref:Gamma-glutamyl-gamma-aminobutyrate hydrolase family protein n=1 Tax=Bifidobacterium amazonense TaxID=2809027 RepID=A0ABS9VY37_9BIFI|nr:gamma-glutamyl-gamma-aminobutyrate hydrolase family protein [Bifidobacterium amazonense]MCH9277038.1 gamma-glutamyl-gamma-aminobutyrate hydrolase family protein [Bifidobacterium amazonense]